MSCVSGTNSVNDGLVFHFDLENSAKSWKGKPTTNLIETNLLNYAKDNGCTVEATGEYYQGMPTYRVTFNYGTLPRIRTNFSYTNGGTYTGSIYYRVVSQGSHTPKLYFREINFGASYAEVTLSSTSWTRAKITHTFTTASSTAMFLLYQATSSSTSDTVIEFAMPQTEVSDIATKFVNGVRLNTASIIDVSPTKSTITAANLTYRQDDTPTFDGTNDYFTLQDQAIPIYDSSYTIEAWIKRSVTGANHGIIGDLQYDWFGLRITSANKVYIIQRQSNPEINSLTGTSNIGTDWTHVTVVFNITSGMSIYVNGNLDATNTNLYYFGLTTNNRGPKYIGRNDSSSFGSSTYYFNGEISNLVGYTRALTAQEVKQNFEAKRTMYDI